jgi:hypothetical protein
MDSSANPIYKRTEVHLGNVGIGKTQVSKFIYGENGSAARCKKIADADRDTKFIGVDLNQLEVDAQNWEQVQADFKKGLTRLENGTVNAIRSDYALGYYMGVADKPESLISKLPFVNSHQPVETTGKLGRLTTLYLRNQDYQKVVTYTQNILDLCHDKLMSLSDVIIRAEYHGKETLLESAQKSKFRQEDVEVNRITQQDNNSSIWEIKQFKKRLFRPEIFEVRLTKR